MSNQVIKKGGDIRGVIESMAPAIAKALPKHITPDRMIRTWLTALNTTPKLAECSKESLLAALMKCSQYGLEPDGRHAHLIPYRGKDGSYACQLIFDYKGLAALVRRSGEVADVHCDVVYSSDEFEASFGTAGRLHHVPNIRAAKSDRGEIIAAYSYVKLKDGSPSYEVLPRWEIEDVKEKSSGYQSFLKGYAKQSPWDSYWPAMAKKTAFRRHTNWLPLSVEIQKAINDDDDRAEEVRFQQAKQATPAPMEIPLLPEPVEEVPTAPALELEKEVVR